MYVRMYVCVFYIIHLWYIPMFIYVYMYHVHALLQRETPWYITHQKLIYIWFGWLYGLFQMYHRQKCTKLAFHPQNSIVKCLKSVLLI